MPTSENELIRRFSGGWRLQHILLIIGVTGLSLTGLAYRYYDTSFGRILLDLEGGFGNRGVLHRICAVFLALTAVMHGCKVLFTRNGHDDFLALMPEKGDGSRWWNVLKAKLAGKEYTPDWGKYTLGQKLQYWMVSVGTILMLVTGAVLMLGHSAMAAMPKWIVDAVRVVHGGQGVELMIFIVLWHLYSTHLTPGNFPMDNSWLTGSISKQRLKEWHPREFRRLFGDGSTNAK